MPALRQEPQPLPSILPILLLGAAMELQGRMRVRSSIAADPIQLWGWVQAWSLQAAALTQTFMKVHWMKAGSRHFHMQTA